MMLDSVYIECPECKTWFLHTEVLSYTTYGKSVYWSDGKIENYHIPEYDMLKFTKCNKCNYLFWLKQCKKIFSHQINSNSSEDKNLASFYSSVKAQYQNINSIPFINYLSIDIDKDLNEIIINDCLALIEKANKQDNTDEIYLRTLIWQHINNYNRNQSNILLIIKQSLNLKKIFNFKRFKYLLKKSKQNKFNFQRFKEIQTRNLQQLKSLIIDLLQNNKTDSDILTWIEIERELGNFSEANRLINELDESNENMKTIFIKKTSTLIKKKSKKIFIVN